MSSFGNKLNRIVEHPQGTFKARVTSSEASKYEILTCNDNNGNNDKNNNDSYELVIGCLDLVAAAGEKFQKTDSVVISACSSSSSRFAVAFVDRWLVRVCDCVLLAVKRELTELCDSMMELLNRVLAWTLLAFIALFHCCLFFFFSFVFLNPSRIFDRHCSSLPPPTIPPSFFFFFFLILFSLKAKAIASACRCLRNKRRKMRR